MKKIFLTFVLTFIAIGMFAQKSIPTDTAVLKLMNIKKGMVSVNSLADSMSKKMTLKNATDFKTEMNVYKAEMIAKAMETFKNDYSVEDIDFIYNECTSDKIDYTDLTNNFFRKWRSIKGNYFFSKAKASYAKYQ